MKNKKKKPLKSFIRNPELDKYSNKVFFKKKVEMANQILKTVGVPKP